MSYAAIACQHLSVVGKWEPSGASPTEGALVYRCAACGDVALPTAQESARRVSRKPTASVRRRPCRYWRTEGGSVIGIRKKRAPRSLWVLLDKYGNYDSGDIFETKEGAKTEQAYAREVYDEKLDIRRYVIAPMKEADRG